MEKGSPYPECKQIVSLKDFGEGRVYHPDFKLYLGGHYWHFEVMESDGNMGVSLECNRESRTNLWECHATVNFEIFNEDSKKSFSTEQNFKFNSKNRKLAIENFRNMEEILNPVNEFLKNNKLMAKVHIKILSSVGRNHVKYSFDKPVKYMTDVVLVVEGQKLHVGKQVLAMNSPVFHRMFYGDFVEKNQKEIEIRDVKHKDFVHLLHLIYPSAVKIERDTYLKTLALADRFQLTSVLEMAEQWLRNCGGPPIEKLVAAEQYNLARLQSETIESFRSSQSIIDLTKDRHYKQLGRRSLQLLLQKLAQLQKDKK